MRDVYQMQIDQKHQEEIVLRHMRESHVRRQTKQHRVHHSEPGASKVEQVLRRLRSAGRRNRPCEALAS